MSKRMRITEKLAVGPQPEKNEFAQLKSEGFSAVVNLRVHNEEEGMLAPSDEQDLVEKQGMTYVHLPISSKQIRPTQVDDFRQFADTLEGPIFVHCQRGKRAGAFAMMHKAIQEGWSGQQTLDEAKRAGFECDDNNLAQFVREYVDEHASSKR